MPHNLTVLVRALTPEHRVRIAAEAARLGFDVRFCEGADEALPLMADTEIFFGFDGRAAELMAAGKDLKWVNTPNAGAEPFTRPGVLPAGAVLTNSAGAYGITIAEHIVMVTLEMLRRRADYLDLIARRQWVRALPIRAIERSRVTVCGTGNLGQEAAKRLKAFEPAALVGLNRTGHGAPHFDRTLPMDRLDEVLPETDILILCLPGTMDTDDLLDARRLALLPRGAYLVNVGRGNCVDEDALLARLASGDLAGAALDVFRQEPLPPDSPMWNTPHLLMTQHISGNTSLPATVDRIADLFLENLARYAAGLPLLRRVDPAAGY